MVLAIVVPAAVTVATLPLAFGAGLVDGLRRHLTLDEPDEPIAPGFLPFLGEPPSIDISEQLPTTAPPHKRAVDKVVIMPEEFLNSLPRPLEFLQSLRSSDSPAEVLRDVEGPFEVFMSLPGPHRELPNPIADIYYLRQAVMWVIWDGRSLWGSGFDNFVRNDVPLWRGSLIESLHGAKETTTSIRDTNVEMRRKMLPVVQKNLTTRLPRTQKKVDKALNAVSGMLDDGLLGSLF